MSSIKCAAPDCDIEFVPQTPQEKYCTDRCRWRDFKRKKYEFRRKNGLCPQCGGKMDFPPSYHLSKASPQYCSACQKYFRERYKKKIERMGENG